LGKEYSLLPFSLPADYHLDGHVDGHVDGVAGAAVTVLAHAVKCDVESI